MSYSHINFYFVDGCWRLKFLTPDDGHYLGDLVFLNLTIEIYSPFHLIINQVNSSKTREEAGEAREEEVHKMSGMEVAGGGGGWENWSKLHCVAWEGGFQHWL